MGRAHLTRLCVCTSAKLLPLSIEREKSFSSPRGKDSDTQMTCVPQGLFPLPRYESSLEGWRCTARWNDAYPGHTFEEQFGKEGQEMTDTPTLNPSHPADTHTTPASCKNCLLLGI